MITSIKIFKVVGFEICFQLLIQSRAFTKFKEPLGYMAYAFYAQSNIVNIHHKANEALGIWDL